MIEDQPGPIPAGVSSRQELDFFAASSSHAERMHKMDLGVIGKVVGGRSEKAGNIAFITIFLCALAIVIVSLRIDWSTQGEIGFKVLAGIFSIITLALGYIFGANTAPKS
jgi:hypothetical protein